MFRAFLLCLCVSCNELGSEEPPPQPSEVSSSASESEKDTPPPAPEIRPIAEVPHPHGRVVAITKHQLSEVALRLKFSFRVVDTVYLQESGMANYRYMSAAYVHLCWRH